MGGPGDDGRLKEEEPSLLGVKRLPLTDERLFPNGP